MSKNIVLFSTKGGVGKTLIAANLAVTLAQDQRKRVCLVDLDVQVPGDMARMLNVSPQSPGECRKCLKKQPSICEIQFIIQSTLGVEFFPAVLRPQQSSYLEPSG